jgi:hypothetical protein
MNYASRKGAKNAKKKCGKNLGMLMIADLYWFD